MGTFSLRFPWKRAAKPDEEGPGIDGERAEKSQLAIWQAGQRSLDARNREVQRLNKLLWGGLFLEGMALVISVAANLHYSGQSQYIPYIIQTDRTGRVLNAQVMKPSRARETTAYQTLVEHELRDWVQDWRAVTTDPYAQKTLADHVYARLDGNGEAAKSITKWYLANDPQERAKEAHIEADVQSLVPQSASVYEVYWRETETNTTDGSKKVSYWRDILTIATNFGKSNPSGANNDGLYIENISTPVPDKKDSND